jgi:hypothetical protein
MFMNNDLHLQITEYEQIDDFFEKIRFVEQIINLYANNQSNPCYIYWKQVLDNLYDHGFNYY